MKKNIFKTLIISCFTLIVGLTMVMNDKYESQALTLQNLLILNSSLAEAGPGDQVDCNSDWYDCFFGCTTKYRCNILTPCIMIMAKASSGEADKCTIPND